MSEIDFEGLRGRLVAEPEKVLAASVMEDAILCLDKYYGSQDERQKALYTEALKWVRSDDNTWAFSFVCVCEALKLDVDCIRKGILKREEEKGKPKKPS